jgi:hypothetical protein
VLKRVGIVPALALLSVGVAPDDIAGAEEAT